MRYKHRMIMILLLILSFLFSCLCGRYTMTFSDLWSIVTGQAKGSMMENVFWNIRVARTSVVALSGAALALSGFVYQNLFRNPLVSPDVLGVSGGASVGAVCAILFAGGSLKVVQISAFAGGILTVFLSVMLSQAIGGNRYFNLIISGIILGALANAVIMALKYIADPTQELAVIDYWLMGSYSLASWAKFRSILIPILAAGGVLTLIRYRLKVLSLGDEEAAGLGVPVVKVRMVCIVAATVLVAAATSVSGIVSWTGLIVPHMVRIIFGENFEENFFDTALCGAALLIAADTMARSLLPSEIPISILTSLLGALSLILFLFYRRNRRNYPC